MKTPAKISSSSSSSSSYSFMVRRRLLKRRAKAAVFRAALKKKQQRLESRCVAQKPAESGLREYAHGVCVNGEFVQWTRGFLVNSGGLPYYLPVVDNHGFLLGEFSRLDDLSFVQDENPLPDTSSFAFS